VELRVFFVGLREIIALSISRVELESSNLDWYLFSLLSGWFPASATISQSYLFHLTPSSNRAYGFPVHGLPTSFFSSIHKRYHALAIKCSPARKHTFAPYTLAWLFDIVYTKSLVLSFTFKITIFHQSVVLPFFVNFTWSNVIPSATDRLCCPINHRLYGHIRLPSMQYITSPLRLIDVPWGANSHAWFSQFRVHTLFVHATTFYPE